MTDLKGIIADRSRDHYLKDVFWIGMVTFGEESVRQNVLCDIGHLSNHPKRGKCWIVAPSTCNGESVCRMIEEFKGKLIPRKYESIDTTTNFFNPQHLSIGESYHSRSTPRSTLFHTFFKVTTFTLLTYGSIKNRTID